MNFQNITPDKSTSLFIKNILVFEDQNDEQRTVLPFFADGYPGLIFYEAQKGLKVYPHEKKIPAFFLYGQTIQPIELIFESSYKIIIFQFYPFILKSFFNINPKSINDDCYDLLQWNPAQAKAITDGLQSATTLEERIEMISSFLYSLFLAKRQALDSKVKQSVQLIIEHNGQVAIKDLCRSIKMNERTFERRFLNETGLLPKQFAKIIQFQSSFRQLTVRSFNKLTDIVYENGFADQSHFIKVFKAFTGKTPKAFSKI